MGALTEWTDVAVIIGVVVGFIGGGYGVFRLVMKIGAWTDTVSRMITENSTSRTETAAKLDAIKAQLDRLEARQESNADRIARLEQKP